MIKAPQLADRPLLDVAIMRTGSPYFLSVVLSMPTAGVPCSLGWVCMMNFVLRSCMVGLPTEPGSVEETKCVSLLFSVGVVQGGRLLRARQRENQPTLNIFSEAYQPLRPCLWKWCCSWDRLALYCKCVTNENFRVLIKHKLRRRTHTRGPVVIGAKQPSYKWTLHASIRLILTLWVPLGGGIHKRSFYQSLLIACWKLINFRFVDVIILWYH